MGSRRSDFHGKMCCLTLFLISIWFYVTICPETLQAYGRPNFPPIFRHFLPRYRPKLKVKNSPTLRSLCSKEYLWGRPYENSTGPQWDDFTTKYEHFATPGGSGVSLLHPKIRGRPWGDLGRPVLPLSNCVGNYVTVSRNCSAPFDKISSQASHFSPSYAPF